MVIPNVIWNLELTFSDKILTLNTKLTGLPVFSHSFIFTEYMIYIH